MFDAGGIRIGYMLGSASMLITVCGQEQDLKDRDWEICKLQDQVGDLRSWLAQMEHGYDNAKAALKMHKTIHGLLGGHGKGRSCQCHNYLKSCTSKRTG